MSFGQMRPKWRCLDIIHNTTCGDHQHLIPAVRHSSLIWVLFILQPRGLGTSQLLCQQQTPLYFNAMFSCLTAEVWPKLAHVAEQRSQAQQQVEKEKSQGAAMAQSTDLRGLLFFLKLITMS